MKKLITVTIASFVALSMFSCKKEVAKQPVPVAEIAAKTDSSTTNKQQLASNCKQPYIIVDQYPQFSWGQFQNGTVVGSFPTQQGWTPTILNKQSWVAGASVNGLYREYTLTNQNDGNLVLYSNMQPGALWSSNTQWQGGNTVFYLQSDWNFVGYKQITGESLWQSGTHIFRCDGWSKLPQIFLFLRNDGDLQIIARVGNGTVTKTAILASTGTAGGAVNANHTMNSSVAPFGNEWTMY